MQDRIVRGRYLYSARKAHPPAHVIACRRGTERATRATQTRSDSGTRTDRVTQRRDRPTAQGAGSARSLKQPRATATRPSTRTPVSPTRRLRCENDDVHGGRRAASTRAEQ
ncbi:uncharacterized protein SCHCODRAFT_02286865 [Schizophyllum commune H4-8]|uniref:uncharacterized protein n=1 Tax=Schizophyllum commune (strain H4-8 / FGSC 9210) TaxID=578458 RepID=UPI00215E379A|nr:uncharacterized protein SCHCODRAFT_02286865 [Schizophyllum commune H4-8]KAI5892241.1 hypothetical protein SCHCODRAFT_02286865 [Schizophyllum commune H4-8]